MVLDRLPRLEDDGLSLPEVGAWAERKYRLVQTYSEMFATAMKGKWGARAFVDLFAGAGRAKIKDTPFVIPTSAMLALQVKDRFDRYIFCEIEPDKLSALKRRASRDTPGTDVRCIPGDCNASVERILAEIPKPERGRTVLSFCVADPYSLANLKFATLSALAQRYVDFLVLIPSYMDAHRNLDTYLDTGNTIVEDFLGDPDWRKHWARAASRAGTREFGAFVVDRFGCSMKRLGFAYDGPGDEVPVRDKHLLLYHLAFFSRSELGKKFWREAKRYSTDQLNLFS